MIEVKIYGEYIYKKCSCIYAHARAQNSHGLFKLCVIEVKQYVVRSIDGYKRFLYEN